MARFNFKRNDIIYDKVGHSYFQYSPNIDGPMIEKQPERFKKVSFFDVPRGAEIRQWVPERPGNDKPKMVKK